MSTIHQSNISIAYVYFDYQNEDAQSGDYVVRTLLKQLLLPTDLIPRELEQVYEDCCSHSKSPDKAFFIQQLSSAAAKFSSVYIMLDALDECSLKTLNDIISLIHQFKASTLKFFCTFRPNLINLGKQLGVSTIYSIAAHDDDIRNYLSIRLKREWRHGKHFPEQIIERLVTAAEGK